MQTSFAAEALADPATRSTEQIIRNCVHCGFCTATCPTYMLLSDELDSPRGRIYLIKDMLENRRQPSAEVVKHLDRCLSCLSCMTTCPSDVNYMHLIDHARTYIEKNHRRPLVHRMIRSLLATVLPHRGRFRLALKLAALASPFRPMLRSSTIFRPLAAMLELAPSRVPAAASMETKALPDRKGRVALLKGCAEPVLRPEFRAAAIRLLNRFGHEVVLTHGEGCCGALVHHLGREHDALASARRNVDAWMEQIMGEGLDAIIVTASGCGTTIKNYGFMLRDDPAYAEKAAEVSRRALDITEYLDRIDLPAREACGVTVVYHPACSLQHGQRVTDLPKRLLARVGYSVRLPAESHLCCGSAGTYNILQSTIAEQLGSRKGRAIEAVGANVVATGNIGCAMQIARFIPLPVVHTVELLDWATGGPKPAAMLPDKRRESRAK